MGTCNRGAHNGGITGVNITGAKMAPFFSPGGDEASFEHGEVVYASSPPPSPRHLHSQSVRQSGSQAVRGKISNNSKGKIGVISGLA